MRRRSIAERIADSLPRAVVAWAVMRAWTEVGERLDFNAETVRNLTVLELLKAYAPLEPVQPMFKLLKFEDPCQNQK